MIYVVATTQVKPDLRDAFIKGAKECIEATRKEKGCVTYRLHQDLESPQQFVMYERWKSVQAHRSPPLVPVAPKCSPPRNQK